MTSTLFAVAFDAADPRRLAAFWSDVLGRPVDDDAQSDGFASIGVMKPAKGEAGWLFVTVPEGKAAKNRCHPDLIAQDLEQEVARVVGLGATEHDAHEELGARWITLSDPEGNEFDIVAGSTVPA
jgi:predicted enzyme related to lactoylglutathione lyase